MTKKGLIIVNTGDGKGKTTAALGMAVRNLGWGRKVSIIQFAKGGWKTGEIQFLQDNGVEIIPAWESTQWIEEIPEAERKEMTEKAMLLAKERLQDPSIDLLILDEFNIMLRYRLILPEDILPLLMNRPEGMTVILTGRNALPEIIAAADLVSEIKEIKHPAQKGIGAQKGIEY